MKKQKTKFRNYLQEALEMLQENHDHQIGWSIYEMDDFCEVTRKAPTGELGILVSTALRFRFVIAKDHSSLTIMEYPRDIGMNEDFFIEGKAVGRRNLIRNSDNAIIICETILAVEMMQQDKSLSFDNALASLQCMLAALIFE